MQPPSRGGRVCATPFPAGGGCPPLAFAARCGVPFAPGDVPSGVWFVLWDCWLSAKRGGAWLSLGSSRRGSRRSTGSRFPGQGPDSASEIVPLSSAPSSPFPHSNKPKRCLYEYSPREMYSVRSHSLRATFAGLHPTRDTCPFRRIGGPGTEITCGSRRHRSSPVGVALLHTNVSLGAGLTNSAPRLGFWADTGARVPHGTAVVLCGSLSESIQRFYPVDCTCIVA